MQMTQVIGCKGNKVTYAENTLYRFESIFTSVHFDDVELDIGGKNK